MDRVEQRQLAFAGQSGVTPRIDFTQGYSKKGEQGDPYVAWADVMMTRDYILRRNFGRCAQKGHSSCSYTKCARCQDSQTIQKRLAVLLPIILYLRTG